MFTLQFTCIDYKLKESKARFTKAYSVVEKTVFEPTFFLLCCCLLLFLLLFASFSFSLILLTMNHVYEPFIYSLFFFSFSAFFIFFASFFCVCLLLREAAERSEVFFDSHIRFIYVVCVGHSVDSSISNRTVEVRSTRSPHCCTGPDRQTDGRVNSELVSTGSESE